MTPTFLPDGLLLPDLYLGARPDDDAGLDLVYQALESGDEDVLPHPGGVFIASARLHGWDDNTLSSLGVRRFNGTLCASEHGIAGNARYQINLKWNEQPAAADGAWLTLDHQRWLLDATLREAVDIAAHVAGRSRAEVFRGIAALQRIAASDSRVKLAGRLATRRIQTADALRIRLSPGEDGQAALPRPVFVGHQGGQPAELELNLEELKLVALRAIQADDAVALGGDRFVVATGAAARNALLTLAAQHAGSEDRARFAENPAAFLPDVEAFDEADYSARVIGVGEAPPVSVGERPSASRDWASDPGGLLLDTSNARIWVPSDRLQELRDAVEAALRTGQVTVDWDGEPLPARADLRDALDRALREKAPTPTSPDQKSRPRVLLIKENEVALVYTKEEDVRPIRSRRLPPVQVELQPHQIQALARLQQMWAEGQPGALLADDMGLGKTLQALVFAAWAAEQWDATTWDVPVAIVAPPSLLEGWLAELEQRLPPDQLATVLWGARDLPRVATARRIVPLARYLRGGGRGVVLEQATVDLDALRAQRPDILLIGYDTLRLWQFALGRVRIGLMIADEAQEVKDPNTLRSRALRAMSYDFGLALTGTPIENSWRDLWTICDYAVPGILGPLAEFSKRYPASGPVRETGAKLAETLRFVLIRRTRALALQGLPACAVRPERRAMPPAQATAYQAELHAYNQRATGILGLLQQLGRVSLHPRIRADLASAADAESWARESARTSVLWDAMRRFQAEESAVLVFVRSLAMQQTLQRALLLGFGLSQVAILNGAVSMPDRHATVRRYRDTPGFRVLIVSPEVGGAGWNLQFASRSVHLERPFNPAVEAQMIARLHRLGQQREVEVVMPVATLPELQTFDEILDELLTDKRDLADAVLAPTAVGDEEIARRFESLVGRDGPYREHLRGANERAGGTGPPDWPPLELVGGMTRQE